MEQLKITLFGRHHIEQGGSEITAFRTQKVLALLALLAAEPQVAHRRETLMTLLWPGMPDASARQNLRQVLYHLRQAIPSVTARANEKRDESVPLVLGDRHIIQLNPEASVRIDVADFDGLLAQSQTHAHVDLFTCHFCYETLAATVALYKGDFLADFYLEDSNEFEGWSEATRQTYRRKALDALEVLTSIAIRRNVLADARVYAEQQIALDDLREIANQQLMEILARSGQRSEALALYENYRRLLAEELGMAPAKRTTDIYEKILSGNLVLDDQPAQGIRGYDLREEIGAGAYGRIFRALQPAIGRVVAVKVIRRRFANDPQFIRRFEAEAQTVARLEHPHIVPLYDYWREPDSAYLVMRFLRGGNLADALAAEGPWPVERAMSLLDQIAAALSAAHSQGIVHRDIKPANILFDEAGYAYLSDFGIAKDLSGDLRLTMEGGLIGTPDYVSPEQLQEGPITPQTDIYSLGAVLYEVLSGEKPYPNMPLMAVMQSHLTSSFPLINSRRPDLPPQIDAVIQRATAKRPSDRYASVLDMNDDLQHVLLGADREVIPAKQVWADGAPGTLIMTNPYKGLRPYREADAGDFYGRETLTAALVARLATDRFLAVVGPSGSGKSSVVRAGLIPALRQGALPGSDGWYVATMTPGTHPLEELELALWPLAVDPPPSLVEPMQRDPRGMLRTIRRILPRDEHIQLLLVIDQFEELFTMVDDDKRRKKFLESLMVAVSDPRSPLRVVVTLRADFYDRPLQYQPIANLFKEHTELVLPLTREELARAIQEPAEQAGVRFEEEVTAAIVADTNNQPGALPLVQYALTELFDARQDGTITWQAYAEIGGIVGALERRADEIYEGLSTQDQEAIHQLFLRLVNLGEGVEDTRRRVRLSELAHLRSQSAIEAFGAARLLIFDRDPLTREPTVEVAHEALLREWQRLRTWLEEAREDIRLQRLLATAVAEWEAVGRDEGYLLRGARLSQYEAWQEGTRIALTESELAFLQASLEARKQREAEEEARAQRELRTAQQLAETERVRAEEGEQAARSLRHRALFLAGALVVAALLAAVAFLAWRQAGENAALAERAALEAQSLALASGAQAALADGDTDQALMLAMASSQITDPPALAQEILYEAAMTPGTRDHIEGGGGWRWAMDVDPENRRVASGADDMAVTVWDLDSGEELMVLAGEHSESIGDVAFAPDGSFLLSGAYDDTLILWDLDTGQAIQHMENPTGDVNGLDISPDGRLAVAGTQGGVVTLWDLETGEMVGELAGHNPELQILPVAFSADGRLIAGGGEDGTAVIWDTVTLAPLQELPVLEGVLFALAFSPDGSLLAAGGQDDGVHLFDVKSGESVGTLGGLPDWLFSLAFSEDGSRLLGSVRDGSLLLWDVAERSLLHTYIGEEGRTLAVRYVDDSTAVSSASTGNVRVWSLADSRLLTQYNAGGYLASAAYSSPGRLAALGLNQLIRLVDLDSGETVQELALPGASDPVLTPGDVTALAFDDNGTRLLSAKDDGTLVLWDTAAGQEIGRFAGHTSRIHDLAFSPDGRSFLSAADDQQVILWDVATGDILFRYTSPTDTVNAVAFSPDGRLVAAGLGTFRFAAAVIDPNEVDHGVRIWNIDTGQEIAHLEGHEGPVVSLSFSPDGSQLLSGSVDTTLRLWDTADGTPLRRFDGHTSGVMSLDFDEDGRYVASGAQDGTVIVWDVDRGDLLRQIGGHEGVIHTVAFEQEGVCSAAEDGWIKQWNPMLDLDQLREWAQSNRYIPELSCEQRARFGLEADEACTVVGRGQEETVQGSQPSSP